MAEAEDDDEGSVLGLFEKGHWVWDESIEGLHFVSDLPPPTMETYLMPIKVLAAAIEFRDDIDFNEQVRFRKRYQRKVKPGQPDIITLQDVRDLAIYTAPLPLMSASLINLLHLPTTERFLRALIFYCQYYLQVSDIMGDRMIEMETKVRTPLCDVVEDQYRENMSDLRVLVAKEYCSMLLGLGDLRKFHHMGPLKKRRSLSNKDARLFETLLRISIQIVWLTLGRKSVNQIELEVHRLFKSEIFNSAEHSLQTDYFTKLSKEEKYVLLGTCLRHDKKLTTESPLLNEVFCKRIIDYRMIGMGTMKLEPITPRLLYMKQAVCLPEETMIKLGVTVGILGMPRATFDTMLRPLPTTTAAVGTGKGSASSIAASAAVVMSGMSSSSRRDKSIPVVNKLYPDILLPPKSSGDDYFPDEFPDEPYQRHTSITTEYQRRRWQNRLKRMLNPVSNNRRRASRYN